MRPLLTLAGAFGIACESSSAPNDVAGPFLLQLVSGDQQSGVVGQELADPLVARVVDSASRPITGQLVNFRVVSGGGSVFAGAALTDDSGVVRERWTLGTSTADSQRVEARAVDNTTGAPLVFGVFNASALADAAATLSKVAGDSQLSALGSPQPESLAVRISDQYGNPVPDDSVLWTAGSGSVSPARTASNAAGVAKTQWTLDSTRSSDTATASVLGHALTTRFTGTGAFPFKAIAGGHAHTCGLGLDGSAYCWGVNIQGELGTGDTLPSATPRRVLGSLTFKLLSVGEETTCAIAGNDAVYCWGLNTSGELGNASAESKSTAPVPVAGGHLFLSISAGQGHVCGITVDSAAYCWGDNYAGNLGRGDTVPSNVPIPVAGGLVFRSVSAGAAHTCGITNVGAAYCWGDNQYGELGIDTISPGSTAPQPVLGGLTLSRIAAGWNFTCALTTRGECVLLGEQLLRDAWHRPSAVCGRHDSTSGRGWRTHISADRDR